MDVDEEREPDPLVEVESTVDIDWEAVSSLCIVYLQIELDLVNVLDWILT